MRTIFVAFSEKLNFKEFLGWVLGVDSFLKLGASDSALSLRQKSGGGAGKFPLSPVIVLLPFPTQWIIKKDKVKK